MLIRTARKLAPAPARHMDVVGHVDPRPVEADLRKDAARRHWLAAWSRQLFERHYRVNDEALARIVLSESIVKISLLVVFGLLCAWMIGHTRFSASDQSVRNYGFFLFLNLVFMVLVAGSMVLRLAWRFGPGWRAWVAGGRNADSAPNTVRVLFGFFVWPLVERLVRWLTKLRRPSGLRASDRRYFNEFLEEYLRQRAARFAARAPVHVQLAWLVAVLVGAMALGATMVFPRKMVRLKTPTYTPGLVQTFVGVFGWPVAKLGGTTPSEGDVTWLLEEPDDAADLPASRAAPEKTASSKPSVAGSEVTPEDPDRTAQWRWFLLHAVFVWGFLLRLPLLGAAWLLSRGACRADLRDQWADDVLRMLIAAPAPTVPPQGETGVEDGPQRPAPRPAEHQSTPPAPVAPDGGDQIVVVGYALRPRGFDSWHEVFAGVVPTLSGDRVTDAGSVGFDPNQRDVEELHRDLAQAGAAVRRLVVVVAAFKTPDDAFRSFLSQLAAIVDPRRVLVVVDELEELRKDKKGDPRRVAERLDWWERYARQAGIPGPNVLRYFDRRHATDASRRRLRADLLGDGDSADPPVPAGKFDRAAAHVLESLDALSADENAPDAVARHTDELHERIRRLYGNEYRGLLAALTDGPASRLAGRGRGVLARVGLELDERTAHVAGGLTGRLKEMFGGLEGQMPDKWGVAAGLLTTAVIGGLTGIPWYDPLATAGAYGLVSKGRGLLEGLKRFFTGEPGPEEDAAGREDDKPVALDTSDMVRSAVLLALLLELQGRDAAQLAADVRAILGDRLDAPLETRGQVEDFLRHVEAELRER